MRSDGVPQRGIRQIETMGAIEVYQQYGPRIIEIPIGADMIEMCFRAHDIWEENSEKLRVRVIRFEDGCPTCVLHLPPATEE